MEALQCSLTNTMARQLLINPLERKCTFDLRSAHYGHQFLSTRDGEIGINLGVIVDNLRHVEASKSHLRRFEVDWNKLRRV